MTDDPFDRLRHEMLSRIARLGYTMQQASCLPGGETYIYTIGLPASLGHPELVVCGLDRRTSVDVIEGVVDLLRAGRTLEGEVLGALEVGVPLWLTPLPAAVAYAHLDTARWWRREHYDGELSPAAKQVIIPDPAGRFPWQPGCQPDYGRDQALLLPEVAVREPGSKADTAANEGCD